MTDPKDAPEQPTEATVPAGDPGCSFGGDPAADESVVGESAAEEAEVSASQDTPGEASPAEREPDEREPAERELDAAGLDSAGPDAAQPAETPRVDTAVENRDAGESPNAKGGMYHVLLPTFEGPLDLLLHLIQQHELDIRDIPILFISQKYVEYILLMQDLNIDLASEYLVMAATLAHIKSKMLLPAPPAGQEDEPEDDLDPRSELVRRLLEYQKYKQAAEHLGKSDVLGRDVFLRGIPAPSVDGPAPLAQVSVFKLFDAFQKLLSRVKQTAEHHIDVDRISISERILQLTDLLKGKGVVPFETLFEEVATRADIVVTFLALLEMTRLRMMLVIQAGPLEPIGVELTITDEHDDLLRHEVSGDDDPLLALARGELPNSLASDELATNEDSPSAPVLSEDEEGLKS